MPGQNNGESSQDDDELDPDSVDGDGDQDLDGDEDNDDTKEKDDHKPEGSDLTGKTQEELTREVLKLRRESARRRISEREAKRLAREANDKALADANLEDQLKAEREARQQSEERYRGLLVQSELDRYLASKHPEYVRSASKIARFIETDDLDFDDPDSVSDAVKSAVDDFIKDLPPVQSNQPGNGQPVGGIGRAPGRSRGNDDAAKKALRETFPDAYRET